MISKKGKSRSGIGQSQSYQAKVETNESLIRHKKIMTHQKTINNFRGPWDVTTQSSKVLSSGMPKRYHINKKMVPYKTGEESNKLRSNPKCYNSQSNPSTNLKGNSLVKIRSLRPSRPSDSFGGRPNVGKHVNINNANLTPGLLLKEFLTAHSKHGIVYNCEYESQIGVCKFIILDTGAYWSEEKKGMVRKNELPVGQYRIPSTAFRLADHFRKVPVRKERFQNEIINLQKLGRSGITPKLFHHFFFKVWLNGRDWIELAAVVMEKADCTLEAIIKDRPLEEAEIILVSEFLESFCNKFVHGDFKVGNIGVNLDNNKLIRQILVLDVDYVMTYGQITQHVFKDRQTRDIEKFFFTFVEKRTKDFVKKTKDVDLTDLATIRSLLTKKESTLPLIAIS